MGTREARDALRASMAGGVAVRCGPAWTELAQLARGSRGRALADNAVACGDGSDAEPPRWLYSWRVGHRDLAGAGSGAGHVGAGVGRGGWRGPGPRDRRPSVPEFFNHPHGAIGRAVMDDGRIV